MDLSFSGEGGTSTRRGADAEERRHVRRERRLADASGGGKRELRLPRAGQIIGAVGTTGYSTGCHLHYSTWANGQLADPISLF